MLKLSQMRGIWLSYICSLLLKMLLPILKFLRPLVAKWNCPHIGLHNGLRVLIVGDVYLFFHEVKKKHTDIILRHCKFHLHKIIISFWQRYPQNFFGPFYFASPEIIEVKICFRQTNRQTDMQTNSLKTYTWGVFVGFFFKLNLLPHYLLCLQGDNWFVWAKTSVIRILAPNDEVKGILCSCCSNDGLIPIWIFHKDQFKLVHISHS